MTFGKDKDRQSHQEGHEGVARGSSRYQYWNKFREEGNT